MGWKLFCLLATDREPGYFGSAPEHDPARAEDIRARLGLVSYESNRLADFDEAMYPQGPSLYIGAYPGGVLLCHLDLPALFSSSPNSKRLFGTRHGPDHFVASFLQLYPDGQVLAAVLQSTVDFWGFSLFEGGRCVRTAAGDADSGLVINAGSVQPEEAAITNGRSLDDPNRHIEGEGLVFAVTGRFFGRPLDQVDTWNLTLTEYRPLKRSLFARLFKAS